MKNRYFLAHLHSHSSLASYSTVGRFRQSKLSILPSREVSSEDSSAGILMSPFTTFRNKVFSLFPLKGKLPTTILQRMMPSDQMSAGLPKYPSRCITSGAMQCGVPQKSQSMKVSLGSCRLKPQSISFTLPYLLIRMFYNFRSRWTTQSPWRYSKALVIWRAMVFAIASPPSFPSPFSQSARERFSHNSVTMLMESSVSMVYWQAGMQGCCTICKIFISFSRLARLSSLASALFWYDLIANFLPSRLRATLTMEYVPRPKMGPRRQSFKHSVNSILVMLFSDLSRWWLSSESMLLSLANSGLGILILGNPSLSLVFSLHSSISCRVSKLRWVCSSSCSSLLEFRMTRVSLPSSDLREKLALLLAFVLIFRIQGNLIGLPNYTSPVFTSIEFQVFRFSFLLRCGLFSLIKLLY